MRRFYIFTVLFIYLLSFTTTIAAQGSSEIVESLTLYDLTHDKMNASYTDSQGNTISVRTNEPSSGITYGRFVYYADLDNPLSCSGESTAGLDQPVNAEGYSRFLLMGKGNATVARSPYFILDFGSSATGIREIQIMGTAAGAVENDYEELLYAFSPVTNPAIKDFEDLPDDYSPLIFKVGQCNYDNLRIKLPEGTASVIFISTDGPVGGWETGSVYSNPAEFHAIRLFSQKKNTTAIPENETDAFLLTQKGRMIESSELANIEVYDLTGRKVAHINNATRIDLQLQAKGIYLIKAESVNGGKTAQMKISL